MKSYTWMTVFATNFLLVTFSGLAQAGAGVPDYDYGCPPASCKAGQPQKSEAPQSSINAFNAIQQHLRDEQNVVNNVTNAAVNAIQNQQDQKDQNVHTQNANNSIVGATDADAARSEVDEAPDVSDTPRSSSGDAAPDEVEPASNIAADVSNVLSGDNRDTTVAADISAILSDSSQMGTHFYGVAGHVPTSSHPGPGWFDTPSYDVRYQRSLIKITSIVRASMTCKITWTGIKLGSAALGVDDIGTPESGLSTIEVPAYLGNGAAVSVEGEISGIGITSEQTDCSDN